MDDKGKVWRACVIKELVMVRDKACCLSSDEFVIDVHMLINYLLVD